MRRFLICIVALFFAIKQDARSQFNFHSQNYIGQLEGEAGTAFQLQSINGFERKTWFFGLGAGLDYYRFRSVPLFLSVNKYFRATPRTLFASLDGGVNFLWDNRTAVFQNNFRKGDFSPSLYLAGGIGYKVAIEKDALLLNIGYSLKYLEEKQEITAPCFNPPCPQGVDKFDYKFNRLSLKLGWQF